MAVLAFLHALVICKIPSMKINIYILLIIFITLLCAENKTPEKILLNAFHRMDGINYSFKMDSRVSGKKKEKHFKVFFHWSTKGKLLSQIRVISINSKRKKPSSFWIQCFQDGSKLKKWMSMPVTGKLKDVSDKKSSKKEFSFFELGFTDAELKSNEHTLLPQAKIDTLMAYVIESKEKDKKGSVKESKKLWIEVDSFIILKVEFYTGSGRLYKSITCSNFHYVEDILFPLSIEIENLKSKKYAQITIKDIEVNPEFDMDIFIPRDQ